MTDEERQQLHDLIAALHDGDKEVRRNAVGALVKIGQPAVEPLLAVLRDDAAIHHRVSEILVEMGQPAVEPLIVALQDDNLLVRYFAVETLVWLNDERAVEPLVAVLRDDDPVFRRAAAEALSKLYFASAVEPLIPLLFCCPERDTRELAAKVLRHLGTPAALEALELWESKRRR